MISFDLLGALASIGAFVAIGWWIDLALDESQATNIRRRLENWWTKFDDITWFNLGPEEGKSAVAVFDRVFGERFWSWRRWTSTGLLIALCCAVAFGTLVLIVWGAGASLQTWPYIEGSSTRVVVDMVCSLLLQALGIAAGLSITRFLSAAVIDLQGYRSLFGFAALFLLSIVLLLVWNPIVAQMRVLTIAFLNYFDPSLVIALAMSFIRSFDPLSVLGNPLRGLTVLLGPMLNVTDGPEEVIWAGAQWSEALASLIRIFFSAFFLGCFFIRRLVHRPLSQLGFVWLTSGKPIFATLFGGIAVALEFAGRLYRLVG